MEGEAWLSLLKPPLKKLRFKCLGSWQLAENFLAATYIKHLQFRGFFSTNEARVCYKTTPDHCMIFKIAFTSAGRSLMIELQFC
jgi:hypothetical protein